MVVLAVGALVASVVAVTTQGSAPAHADSERREAASERRQRVIDYWTPERVRGAVPATPILDVPAHHRPGHAGGPGGSGGPGGGGDDGGDGGTTEPSGTITGAPWEGGSAKGQVGETTGKVLFTMGSSNYVCSGSVVGTSTPSKVVTAGHCVHRGDNKTTSWATNWMFIPAYEDGGSFSSCGTTLYGCWTAKDLVTTTGWYSSGAYADDTGFAVMDLGGKGTTELVTAVGSQAIAFGQSVALADVLAFGYPAAKMYSGRDLIYCAGTAFEGVFAGTVGLNCDMTSGSSGGPWYGPFHTPSETGTAVSVVSHGFRSLKGQLFGPVFDGPEEAAYNGRGPSRPDPSS